MRVLMVGFGNVGRAVFEVLSKPSEFPGLAGSGLSFIGVTTRSHGSLVGPNGIDLRSALDEVAKNGRFTEAHPAYSSITSLEAAQTLDYDVLVEVSTLNVASKGHPAIDHVRAALARGRHAVTANKGPVAWEYSETLELARKNGCSFRMESTVMDGIPIFNLAEYCMRGCTFLKIEGILNSTSNCVLCLMERGLSRQEAVLRAQEMGIAEADPRNDLEGWDSAVKVTALANVLFGASMTPEQVERSGIMEVTPERIAEARRRGFRLKLLCEVWREGGAVRGKVGLKEIPLGHPYAELPPTNASIITFVSDLLEEFRIVEEAQTVIPTAYGVLSDLLDIKRRHFGSNGS